MLTGTPLDLTVIPELLQWLGKVIPIAWLVLLLAALTLVWVKAKSATGRSIGTALVLAVLVGGPALVVYNIWQTALSEQAAQEVERAKFRARYELAEALFKKRCETAGAFIYKTVPDVKGIVWMKWRPTTASEGQFDLDDPVGHWCGGEECIEALLHPDVVAPRSDVGAANQPPRSGYQFVEAKDPHDGLSYRYTLSQTGPSSRAVSSPDARRSDASGNGGGRAGSALDRRPIAEFTARYGLSWDDVSAREDREHWIAGGSLSVVERQTGEILATLRRYAFDWALGDMRGNRSPWGFAMQNACPPFPLVRGSEPRVARSLTEEYEFAASVLIPFRGEIK